MKPYKINLYVLIFGAITIFSSATIDIILVELKVEKEYSISLLILSLQMFFIVIFCYKKRSKVVYVKWHEKFNYYAAYFFYLPVFLIFAIFILIVAIKNFM